jgi:hypothetical protein
MFLDSVGLSEYTAHLERSLKTTATTFCKTVVL